MIGHPQLRICCIRSHESLPTNSFFLQYQACPDFAFKNDNMRCTKAPCRDWQRGAGLHDGLNDARIEALNVRYTHNSRLKLIETIVE